MRYYLFRATSGRAIAVTNDHAGSKLPHRIFGGWAYVRDLDVLSQDVVDAVERHGYLFWPPKPLMASRAPSSVASGQD